MKGTDKVVWRGGLPAGVGCLVLGGGLLTVIALKLAMVAAVVAVAYYTLSWLGVV